MKKTTFILSFSLISIAVILLLVVLCYVFLLRTGTPYETPSGECSISRNKTDYIIGESGSIGYICTYKGKECVPSFKLVSGIDNDLYEIEVEFTDLPTKPDNAIVYDKNGIKEKYISFVIPNDARHGSYRLIVEFENITEIFEHVINVE